MKYSVKLPLSPLKTAIVAAGSIIVVGGLASPARAQYRNARDFVQSDPQTAQQVGRDPALLNNPQYLDQHPSLHRWIQQDPAVRQRLREHPEFLVNRGRYWNREHREGNFANPA